jgi:hypothetical protein
VHAGHCSRRREFWIFINDLVAKCPGREIHEILDNLDTHNPKTIVGSKPSQPAFSSFSHTAPGSNQVELLVSILSRGALHGTRAGKQLEPQLRQMEPETAGLSNPAVY